MLVLRRRLLARAGLSAMGTMRCAGRRVRCVWWMGCRCFVIMFVLIIFVGCIVLGSSVARAASAKRRTPQDAWTVLTAGVSDSERLLPCVTSEGFRGGDVVSISTDESKAVETVLVEAVARGGLLVDRWSDVQRRAWGRGAVIRRVERLGGSRRGG